MTKKIIALTVAFLFAGVGSLLAATSSDTHDVTISIVEVALLGVDDTSAITLSTVAPGTAGDDVTGQTDSTKYLHYTCLNAGGTTRVIDAQLSAAAPAGTALLLTATPAGGEGTGAGQVSLTNASATNIITAIGSVATGSTVSTDGANLAYVLSITDVASLVVGGGATLTVTFTLQEDV